jgi:hypothetical protein
MSMHGTMRFRRCLTVAAVVALLAALSLASVARAASSGDVEVTANVTAFTPTLTLTLCDQSADFGSGLNAYGDPVTSTDNVTPIKKTDGLPDGAFYRWDPNCDSGEHFFEVDANVSWTSTVCATAGTITSAQMTLDDLRYYPSTTSLTYFQIASASTPFSLCTTPSFWTSGSPGTTTADAVYYLQVDPADGTGSFAATTTFEVTA